MRLIYSVLFFNILLLLSLSPCVGSDIIFFSVGQGDAAFGSFGSASVLIDAGPTGEVARALSRRLNRRKYIDIVFISHVDKDHWGGLPEVITRYKIGAIVFPSDDSFPRKKIEDMPHQLASALYFAERSGTRIVALSAGSSVDLSGHSFAALSPDNSILLKGDNDRSLVLRLSSPDTSALFVGDIGKAAEKNLVKKYGEAVNVDILKVSHHGAKSSSGADFLTAVSPEISVISVGKNFYGHPSAETIARLMESGSNVLRTDILGDIAIPLKRRGHHFKNNRFLGLASVFSRCYTYSR